MTLKFNHEYFEDRSYYRPTIAVLVYMYDSEGAMPKEVARMQIDRLYWPMIKRELQKIGVTSPAWN